MNKQTDKNDEVATNFFDDATSEEEESNCTQPSRTADPASNTNGGGIPLESPVRPGNSSPGKAAPPRPPRPSALNLRVAPGEEDILTEGFRAIDEQNGMLDRSGDTSVSNGFGSNRISKVSMRSMPTLPEGTKDEKLLQGHVLAIQALLLSGGVSNQQVGSAVRKLNFPPPAINVDSEKPTDSPVGTPSPSAKHKSIHRQSHISLAPIPNEAILALTLRTRRKQRSWKVTELKIPARQTNVPIVSEPTETQPSQSEKHFKTLDFDDAHFFRRLRDCYHHLAGPFRFLSARGLHHIEISHSDDCAACESGEQLHTSLSTGHRGALSRSPMRVVSLGLSDSFSQANLMAYYRRPSRGKSSYMFVHWAHRLASTPVHLQPPAPLPALPPVPPPAESSSRRGSANPPSVPSSAGLSPVDNSTRRGSVLAPQIRTPMDERRIAAGECVAGLEFVQGWVVWKIALAVAAALLLSVLATLLWILVGVDSYLVIGKSHERSGRIIAGCLLGGLFLALEVVLIAVWIGMSWLMD